MSFPYNINSSQRQMFPAAGQAQAPGALNMIHQPGSQSHGPMQRYPNPMYGNQPGYVQQPYQVEPQGFQQGFGGYHMGTHPGPRMQMPSKMVMQQQMLEQQKRMAEKQQKQNEELMKKKTFEAKQRKLQAFKGKAGAKSNPLNELFGKKDGKSDTSDLIGSLGSGSTQKSFAKTSIFSRPGGCLPHSPMSSASHMPHLHGPVPSPSMSGNNSQHLLSHGAPGQGGQFFPNTYSAEMLADPAGKASGFGDFKGSTGQGFGSFASGSDCEFGKSKGTLAGQTGSDDAFSDFQEATKSLFAEARMGISSTGSAPPPSATSTAQGTQPFGFLSQGTGNPSGLQGGIFGSTSSAVPGAGRELTDSYPTMPHDQQAVVRFPSTVSTTASSAGGSLVSAGVGMHEVAKQRTSSLSGVAQVPVQSTAGLSGSTVNRTSSFSGQPGFNTTGAPFTGNNTGRPSIHGSLPTGHGVGAGYAHSSTPGFSHSMQGAGYGNLPVTGNVLFGHGNSGGLPHPAVPGTSMPHSGSTVSMINTSPSGYVHAVAPAISVSDGATIGVPSGEIAQEEEETEPEDPLKALYGLDLPDWVINGTDLPGVYKDVVAKCTSGPDMIDTNVLYPILLYSDLPRDTLGIIWNKANHATPGQLNHLELRILLGLVALAQAGIKAERLTLEKLTTCKAAPIPTFPEEILLKSKGEGWSFSEQQSSEGSIPRSRHDSDRGSTSSLSSSTSGSAIDPNDRYSAFRMHEHPTASLGTAVSSGMVPSTKDILPSFTVAGGNTTQPHNTQWNLPSGEMSTTQSQNTQWNLPSGGWQAPSKNVNTTFTSIHAQDEFGSFQSTTPQSTGGEDFGDFSDFQSGAADGSFSSTSAVLPPVVGPVSTAAGHSQVPTMSPSLISPVAAPVITATSHSSTSNLSDSSVFQQQPGKATEDDFGAFPDSSVPSRTTLKDLALQFNALGSSSGTPSKPEETTQQDSGYGNLADLLSGVSMKKVVNLEATSIILSTNALHSPIPTPSVGSGHSYHSALRDTNEATDDKYDIFRTLSLEDQKSVFDTKAQAGQTEVLTPNAQANDNSFGEFEEFQGHEQKAGPGADDFGEFSDFKSKALAPPKKETSDLFGDFSSFPQPSQMVSSENFGDFQDVTKNTGHTQLAGLEFGNRTFDNFHTQNTNMSDFGSFPDSVADTNKSTGNSDIWNMNAFEQKPVGAKSENGNFASFGSFASAPTTEGRGFIKHKPITDITSVPLEPSQRYKALSAEFEDVDKHVSVWGRCLNSCLLTMTTTSFLIQKMIADSVQEEVLKSKEGSKYFAAVVEVYRVTKRIRASIQKSAPNNAKLKDILEETERTWKNIANVLSGSEIMPQISSLDFSASHVSSEEDSSLACGVCLLNVNKTSPGASKHAGAHLTHAGRQYHTTCANFWCNRVDSVLPSLLPICGLL